MLNAATICFNYLQQRFYLVEPTMKALAKGNNSSAIFKLIKVLISTQQQDYEEAIGGNTMGLTDISEQLEVNQKLFGTDDLKATSMMDNTFLNFEDQEYEEQEQV